MRLAAIWILGSICFICLPTYLEAEDDQSHQPPQEWLLPFEPGTSNMPSPTEKFNEEGFDWGPASPSVPKGCPYQNKKLETLLV